MQMAFVNGVHIHYQLTGSPDDPLVVFSNSLGTDFRIWSRVTSRLENRVQLLVYDKRGHGLSDGTPSPYSIYDHADDLAGLLDHLNLRKAIICGISVGGMVALALASRHPGLLKGLILCDTAHKIGEPRAWADRIELIGKEGISPIVDMVSERWFSSEFHRNRPEEVRGWKNMLANSPLEGYIGTCHAIKDADLTEAARGIQLPAMCLCGDEDQSTPPDSVRELSRLISGSSFSLIEKAGHLPCIEQPDILANHILEFIQGA